MQLKEYQQEALIAVQNAFSNNCNSQLASLPTGTGKTVLMAAIVKYYNKKTLILVHREELIAQTMKTLRRYWPSVDIGICKATINEIHHQVVVGMVQTCRHQKRLQQLKEKGFDLLCIDEAHHSSAPTYQAIINALGFKQDPQKLLVGFTATPERGDSKGLGDVFNRIVFSRSIAEMINAKHLSPVLGRRILTTTSLKGIKTHAGDFMVGQLSHAVNTPKRNALVVDKYIQHATGRKTVAFCVDVKHVHALTAAFQTKGINAAAIYGAMQPEERKKALSDFNTGIISVLVSCGVLTEGFDEPSITCIIMARPTKSKLLYTQCIGRGLRLHPGKENCLVLDFTDRYHNICKIHDLRATIPGVAIEEDGAEKTFVKMKPRLPFYGNIIERSDTAFNVVPEKKEKNLKWVMSGTGAYSLADDVGTQELVIQKTDGGYVAHLYSKDSVVAFIEEPTSFLECKSKCNEYALSNMKVDYADANGEWFQRSKLLPPTPGQIGLMEQNGIPWKGMSKADAYLAIRRIFARSRKRGRDSITAPVTGKQQYVLKQAGIDYSNMTRRQAMIAISQLKQNTGVQYGDNR